MRHQLRSAGEDAVSPRIITQLVKVSAKVCIGNKTTVICKWSAVNSAIFIIDNTYPGIIRSLLINVM